MSYRSSGQENALPFAGKTRVTAPEMRLAERYEFERDRLHRKLAAGGIPAAAIDTARNVIRSLTMLASAPHGVFVERLTADLDELERNL